MAARTKKRSQDVTDNSNAMDLKNGIFKEKSLTKIAASLKRSAEQSHRRKTTPFRCDVDAHLLHQPRWWAAPEIPEGRA